MGVPPSKEVILAVAKRVAVMKQEFSAQHLSNTIWALAQLGMDRADRAGMDAESRDAVENLLEDLFTEAASRKRWDADQYAILGWSSVVLDFTPTRFVDMVMDGLFGRLSELDELAMRQVRPKAVMISLLISRSGLNLNHIMDLSPWCLMQAHQFFLTCELDPDLSAITQERMNMLNDEDRTKCREAFERAASRVFYSGPAPSKCRPSTFISFKEFYCPDSEAIEVTPEFRYAGLQRDVSDCILELGVVHKREAQDSRSGYTMDVLVTSLTAQGRSIDVAGDGELSHPRLFSNVTIQLMEDV